MTAFKDFLEKDIREVFFNADEFAELHNVNGHEMRVIVEGDTSSRPQRGSLERSPIAEGVFKTALTVFILKVDLPVTPVVGEMFRLDGALYFVTRVTDSLGLLEIGLEANEI